MDRSSELGTISRRATRAPQRTAAKPTVVERDLIRAAIHSVPHRVALADLVSGGSGSLNSTFACGLLSGWRIAGLVAEYGAVAHAAPSTIPQKATAMGRGRSR